MKRIMMHYPYAYPVQEDALGMMTVIGRGNLWSAKTIQALARVVGLSEYLSYTMGHGEVDKIPPKEVKKRVTGSSTAEKEEVAMALEQFVGKREYACDDESDAVAVGIAWLLQNNFLDDPYVDPQNP